MKAFDNCKRILLLSFVFFSGCSAADTAVSTKNKNVQPDLEFDGYAKHNVRATSIQSVRIEAWMSGAAAAPWVPIDVFVLVDSADDVPNENYKMAITFTLTKAIDPAVRRLAKANPNWERKGNRLYAVIRDVFKSDIYVNDRDPDRKQLENGSYYLDIDFAINKKTHCVLQKIPYVAFTGDYKDYGGIDISGLTKSQKPGLPETSR